MDAQIKQQLESTWSNHALHKGTITVVSAHPGTWKPRQGCSTPRLWILLCGHYRTFTWTRAALAEVANLSAAGCYMVVAAVPAQVEATQRTGYWSPLPGALGLSSRGEAAPALMAESTAAFGGRLAHVVINRTGDYDRVPAGLAVGWHAAWAVARWAACHHRMNIDPASVLVRTRPDVLLRSPFSITALQRYFRHGEHGAHLTLGQDVREGYHWFAQSDYFMTTSFGAYETDVGLPLELSGRSTGYTPEMTREDLYDRGYRNGWGNRPNAEEPCICLPFSYPCGGADSTGAGAGAGADAGAGDGGRTRCGQRHAVQRRDQLSWVQSCWPVVVESPLVVPSNIYHGRQSPATVVALRQYPRETGRILRTPPNATAPWPPPLHWNSERSRGRGRERLSAQGVDGNQIELTDGVKCACPPPPRNRSVKDWPASLSSALWPITTKGGQLSSSRGPLGRVLFYKCKQGMKLVPENGGPSPLDRACETH